MPDAVDTFITRWAASGAAERANKDTFLLELCDVLGVDRPRPTTGDGDKDLYVFERDAKIAHPGGEVTIGKVDLYKAGCFIAAHDKRINDDTWRLLEPGRKELLLPLGDEGQMRSAAKQVVAMKMSQSATKAYVREMRAATGKKTRSRTTGPVLHQRMKRVRSVLDAAELLRNVRRVAPTLTVKDKVALRGEVEAIRDRARDILEILRAK